MSIREVSYETTIDDFRNVLTVVDRNYVGIGSPVPRWKRFLSRIVSKIVVTAPIWACVFFLLILAFTGVQLRLWHLLVIAIMSCLAGACALWSVQDKAALRLLSAQAERQSSPIVRLTEKGVEARYGTTHTFTPWSSYSKVEVIDAYIFLFYDHLANFIPISAFESTDEMIDFVKFADAKIKENRPG